MIDSTRAPRRSWPWAAGDRTDTVGCLAFASIPAQDGTITGCYAFGGARPPDRGAVDVSLFSEPVLVVRQKPEIVESTALYAISDRNGLSVGAVANVGMRNVGAALRPEQLGRRATAGADNRPTGFIGASKAAFDAVRSVVGQLPYRLEVRNESGAAVLVLTSGERGFFDWDQRSLITVSRGDGEMIGTITLQDVGWLPHKPLFALEAGGQRVGTIVADEWYTVGHHVLDAHEREVARIAPLAQGLLSRPSPENPRVSRSGSPCLFPIPCTACCWPAPSRLTPH